MLFSVFSTFFLPSNFEPVCCPDLPIQVMAIDFWGSGWWPHLPKEQSSLCAPLAAAYCRWVSFHWGGYDQCYDCFELGKILQRRKLVAAENQVSLKYLVKLLSYWQVNATTEDENLPNLTNWSNRIGGSVCKLHMCKHSEIFILYQLT